MQLDKTKIHPLLRSPAEISMDYRDELMAAYHDRINSLTHFMDYRDKLSSDCHDGLNSLSSIFQASHDQWQPPFPVTIYFYSDNGGRLDDTAPKEIQRFLNDSANAASVLSGITPPRIEQANTPAQAWVQGGFDLAQTTRHGLSGVGNVTFLNCAPRIDERGAEGNKSNKGEPIYVGILPDGHVVSANSRYNFAFFRDAIENGEIEIFESRVQPDGTQFRSRDIFPTHAVVLANQLTQNIDKWKPQMSIEERRELLAATGYVDLDAPLKAEDIPELEQFTVASIDVHENVKLNVRVSELDPQVIEHLKSNPFDIILNDATLAKASFTERMFDRKEDEPGFSVGSSGKAWQGAANPDGFIELSIIGGEAAKALKIEPSQFRKPLTITIPSLAELKETIQTPPAPVISNDTGGEYGAEAHA